jgi:hypothetical protein
LYVSKAEPAQVKHLSDPPLNDMLLAQTLQKARKACKEKHSSLLQTFINYGRKSFIALGPHIENLFTTLLKIAAFHVTNMLRTLIAVIYTFNC